MARGRSTVSLNDFKDTKRNEGAIDIETDKGVFTIDPPELWDDDVVAAATSNDAKLIGEALLGKKRYAEFREAGGNATILLSIVQEEHGLTPGESPAS